MGSIDAASEAKIRSFAEDFKLTHMLPFDWHVTLAYKYSLSNLPSSEVLAIKTYVTEQLQGKSFLLGRASFCSFNDMTNFTPHDGLQNPFDVTFHMLIPSSKVGVLIGRGGATILGVNQESGAKVQIARQNEPDSDERRILFTGTRLSVNKAEQLVRQIVEINNT